MMFDGIISRNLRFFREFESELVVSAIKFGVDHSHPRDPRARYVRADNNPALDWGNQHTFVKLGADGSLQDAR